MPEAGFPIVLTADRTLMADYQVLLDGMMAGSQTTTTPGFMMHALVSPPLAGDSLRAHARRWGYGASRRRWCATASMRARWLWSRPNAWARRSARPRAWWPCPRAIHSARA